jgi:magnesium and cobalt exporter, CNNM family
MTLLNLALLLGLVIASMSLAAVEAAFYLVKRRRIGRLAAQSPRAVLAHAYLDDPPSLLMPVHIGTYTAHVAMTILISSMLFDVITHWSMLVAFFVMLGYLLFFRLTLPYALVRRSPERSLLLLLPAFDLYARAMGPLVNALRLRAGSELNTEDSAVPPLVPAVPPPPVHDPDEARAVDSLARFAETLVRDVMTPRPDVVAIPAGTTVGELRRVMRETKYSRIAVFGENLDDIVGVAEVRDLIDFDGAPDEPLQPLVRPILVVPETKHIDELLRELQAKRVTFAAVVDEYGATVGVISVEDILEELVGEIKDEHDVDVEPIIVEPDGAYLVEGRLSVPRLEQALETVLDDGKEVGTVGGLVTNAFGRVPRAGDHMQYQGFEIEVVDAERKRVHRVRFRRLTPVQVPPTDPKTVRHE